MRCSRPTNGNFNPRSPHGERRSRVSPSSLRRAYFNPRSPHGERPSSRPATANSRHFNPRSPHGERRGSRGTQRPRVPISTHAPRTGSDISRALAIAAVQFQPTLPARGATAAVFPAPASPSRFQPTLPARGATGAMRAISPECTFQPTLPARGATCKPVDQEFINLLFQPTLPARGATAFEIALATSFV